MSLREALARHRLLPVLTVSGADAGRSVAEALAAGGLPVAEVTLRVEGALEALAAMAGRGDLLVGAGTVTTSAQVDAVVDAGAAFVVSPGFAPEVAERCRDRGVEHLPGVATPSEVMRALAHGLRTLKLFPAGLLGGPAAVRALAAPFPEVTFVPTGGVGAEQVGDYLADPAVTAVGGSWMVPAASVHEGRWDDIERRVRRAVELAGEPS